MAVHRDLPETELHEPKGILSATTADAGKVLTPSGTTNGQGELRALTRLEVGLTPAHGSMNITDNSTAVSITAAVDSNLGTNTDFQEITTAAGFTNMKNMSSGINSLIIQQAGTYQVDFWANLKVSTTATVVAIKFVVNGTDFVNRRPKALLPNPADPGNIAGCGIHDFAVGDEIKLYAASTKTTNLTVEDMAFTLNIIEVA